MTLYLDRLTLPDPSTYEPGPRSVVLGGVLSEEGLHELTPDQAVFVAEQMTALVRRQVVTVICDVVTGYFRVRDVQVSPLDAIRYAVGQAEWQVTLERVLAAELPVIESVVAGVERAHDTEAVAVPWHAVPGQVIGYQPISPLILDVGVKETRDVEGGTVLWSNVADDALLDDPVVYSGTARWQVRPEFWFEGGCGITREIDGADLHVIGTGDALVDDPWWVGNGMVRFRAWDDALLVAWYEDTWSETFEFQLMSPLYDDERFPVTWSAARVVYNGPDRATVQALGSMPDDLGSLVASRVTARATVHRGSPWVDLRITTSGRVAPEDIRAAVPAAVTDTGWGMRLTDYADGWTWAVAVTAEDFTLDTDAGILTPDVDPGFRPASVGIGARHSTWTGMRGADSLHSEWYAPHAERTTIGTRV